MDFGILVFCCCEGSISSRFVVVFGGSVLVIWDAVEVARLVGDFVGIRIDSGTKDIFDGLLITKLSRLGEIIPLGTAILLVGTFVWPVIIPTLDVGAFVRFIAERSRVSSKLVEKGAGDILNVGDRLNAVEKLIPGEPGDIWLEFFNGRELIFDGEKIGATEGLLVDSILGGLKLICNGRFVCTFEVTELGIFADARFDTGIELAFWPGNMSMIVDISIGAEGV
jgi:hypothetical protein